jgi:hypothetical protein
MHHYITRYLDENGKDIVESWLQINIFGLCFSKRQKEIKDNHSGK